MYTGYQMEDQEGLYYITFQVVEWIDTMIMQADSSLKSYCKSYPKRNIRNKVMPAMAGICLYKY
ncbi:MAG: hypothetical protein JXB24_12445 [Bacteroidales bacterium]|nr:hypothetical protein [Bacteroidales bacterium]